MRGKNGDNSLRMKGVRRFRRVVVMKRLRKKGLGSDLIRRWVGIDGMRDCINMISNVPGWERVSWKEWDNDNGWVERIRMDE